MRVEAAAGEVIWVATYVSLGYFFATRITMLAQISQAAGDPNAKMTELFGTDRTREQQVPIIDDDFYDTERITRPHADSHVDSRGLTVDIVSSRRTGAGVSSPR